MNTVTNVDEALTELLRIVIDNHEGLQAKLAEYADTDSRGAAKRFWNLVLEPYLYRDADDWDQQMFLPVLSANVLDMLTEMIEERL